MNIENNRSLEDFKRLMQNNKKFTDEAVLELTKALGQRIADKKDDTTTQVNKFYHLARISESLAKQGNLQQAKVKLYLLKAQINYARARKTISEDFRDFFDFSLNKVLSNPNELTDFLTFFEAVYAYFYFQTQKNQGRI